MNARDSIRIRMYIALLALAVVPLLVMARIGGIHLYEADELRERGLQQAHSEQTIPAMRGSILDRNGRALAINTAEYDLALDPTIEGFAEQASQFYNDLSEITGTAASRYRQRVEDRASPQYVMITRGLSEQQRTTIEQWDVPGLILTPRFARTYSHGTLGAHILGHISSDGQGLAGLELQYDEALTGTPGSRAVQRDRHGRIKALVGGKVVEPVHGENLVLTVDVVRQAALEDELQRGVDAHNAAWGTAVAMDPHTGEVLAMANVPTYDPNRAAAFGEADRRNRAITDRFEPGSTFKFVAAAAALEQGYISLSDTIDTGQGSVTYYGHTMRDVSAYGAIPFREVLSKSSNVGTAHVADMIDEGALYQYARNFGFNQPTWIDLPGEVSGVLRRPSEWSRTTRTSMSIGYEVAVTPIQLLTAYSAVANGGYLVAPHIVRERRDFTGATQWAARPDTIRKVLQEETTHMLTEAFEEVVQDGTATRAQIDGLPIAGKTGTALGTRDGQYTRDQARASFVGSFPADDPQVALLVIIGSPQQSMYGGEVAAPIFNRIARRWLTTLPDVSRRLAGTVEMPSDTLDMPDDPGAAQSIALEASDTSVLPDFRGTDTRSAMQWLEAQGVSVSIEGRGTVVSQSHEPGSDLPDTITLTSE